MSNLVIVESPAKARTIKKYLGKDYDIIASMGHVRDLPEKRLSVDVKNSFKPTYTILKGKEKIVEEIQHKAKKSKKIFLATDPDREGEAISWHLSYLLGLDPQGANRVTFNEITKTGVGLGMKSPRAIDTDLVNAQQARRILDRLVGYKLSPFLSKKIHKGLSAGRVQSVAVRIIVDREEEIRKFKSEEYWSIDADFIPKGSKKHFSASFYGDLKNKIDIKNESEAKEIFKKLENKDYKVLNLKKGKRKKNPAPPFITSTLQQDASRKLGFQIKRTMKVAQELYEGLEIEGLGAMGLITYMRTDSLRISEDAIKEAQDYILSKWGKKYLPPQPRRFKTKASAQDGHEAIRPSTPKITPEQVKNSLSSDQYKLYKLIWERFIACQMSSSVQSTTGVDITEGEYLFKASGYTVDFDGFTVLYTEGKDIDDEKEKALPDLEENMPLRLKDLNSNQHFTQPPPRYTEASLIKTLEEYGVGRPSTYAATISTITSREYVTREAKTLKPTELGEATNGLMKKGFPKIVNVKFTAQMENDLDVVESGKIQWTKILEEFYTEFSKTLEKAKEDMKDDKIELKEDQTDIVCEKCGRKMVIKRGRFGKFIACPGYPECTHKQSISHEIGVKCPKCKDGNVTERKSKKGRAFFGCGNFPKCRFISWDKPLNDLCPKCGDNLYQKQTKKTTKIYCKTENCGYEKTQNNE
ncbi:MAG: type I DNA topoisomerase [Oscillospiraceae bacterium]|jgi:DNA topoisomerase-1|nr:type I DNA topoisomerase [Oscillospiraceae bacterium]